MAKTKQTPKSVNVGGAFYTRDGILRNDDGGDNPNKGGIDDEDGGCDESKNNKALGGAPAVADNNMPTGDAGTVTPPAVTSMAAALLGTGALAVAVPAVGANECNNDGGDNNNKGGGKESSGSENDVARGDVGDDQSNHNKANASGTENVAAGDVTVTLPSGTSVTAQAEGTTVAPGLKMALLWQIKHWGQRM